LHLDLDGFGLLGVLTRSWTVASVQDGTGRRTTIHYSLLRSKLIDLDPQQIGQFPSQLDGWHPVALLVVVPAGPPPSHPLGGLSDRQARCFAGCFQLGTERPAKLGFHALLGLRLPAAVVAHWLGPPCPNVIHCEPCVCLAVTNATGHA